jgi:MFS transporter, CP family, cyanate transporter
MTAFSHTPVERTHSGAPWVVMAGVAAGMHVGKLPALLPLIADEMSLSRFQTGWLLAVFQIAGMLLGVIGGLLADRIGRRRLMLSGLTLTTLTSMLAPWLVQRNDSMAMFWLLAFRSIESFGFLAMVLPGPGLLQRLVKPSGLRLYMGWWGAYMPMGMALGLAAVPLLAGTFGWRGVWLAVGIANAALAIAIWRFVPPETKNAPKNAPMQAFMPLLITTLTHKGPWLLSLLFMFYAAQWMCLFGFLPSVYGEQGISLANAGWLTAVAVLANAVGNVLAGSPKNKMAPHHVVILSALTMWVCAASCFGVIDAWLGIKLSFEWRYVSVIVFSCAAGFTPGTIFGLVNRLAPILPSGERAIGTTTGMFQQSSSLGQVVSPLLVGWMVQSSGQWISAWIAMSGFALGCILVAFLLKSNSSNH